MIYIVLTNKFPYYTCDFVVQGKIQPNSVYEENNTLISREYVKDFLNKSIFLPPYL